MIEVLVAEDELPILRVLSKNIERENGAFKVIAMAENGQQAIGILKEKKVRVAFLDINMPILDGIAVLEYISENKLPVIPVIISGYQEFTYAQSAIRLGAFDYLLKPVKKIQLKELLHKIEIQLSGESHADKQKMYTDMIQGEHGIEKSQDRLPEKCYFGILYFGSYKLTDEGYFLTQRQRELQNCFMKFMELEFDTDDYWMVNGKCQAEKILIFQESVLGVVPKLKRICEQAWEETQIPITVVMHKGLILTEDIHRAYKGNCSYGKAHMHISRYLFVLNAELGSEKEKFMEKEIDFDEAVIKNVQGILGELDEIMEKVQDNRYLLVRYLKRFFRKLSTKVFCNYSYDEMEEDILRAVEISYSKEELYEKMQGIIMECFTFDISNRKNKQALAWDIKKYLESNYKQSVSNQELSGVFGFVPTYLRSIFREFYEMSPSEYLQQIRLDKAEEMLLLEPEISLRDISEEIGYHDALYFSKTFKKELGMTPSEYRREKKQCRK